MSFNALIQTCTQYFSTLIRFPAACLLCGGAQSTEIDNLCLPCYHSLPILPHHCLQCGHFLSNSVSLPQCGRCLIDPPPFTRLFALFPYKVPLISLISMLKFQRELTHARLFGKLLANALPFWYREESFPDIILPIPLHPDRLIERGFNQSIEIAKPIAKACQIHLDTERVIRKKSTMPQSQLSASARKINMKEAFAVKHAFKGEHIAIVDDVVTTGHTISACAKLLKQQGAGRIDIWCCARNG